MKILICFLLSFILTLPVSAGELRNDVEYTYLSQIGVREATGQNDGIEVEKYLASTNLGAGYAWCAAFVNWVYVQNGIDTPQSPAWSPSWFPNDRCTNTPQTGDVFGIYFNNLGRIAHVGFIHRYGPKTTLTVEGNTNNDGSREGIGVFVKRRLTRQLYLVSNWIDHG
jgi:hypothetical protein